MDHSIMAEEAKRRAMSPTAMASHLKKEAKESIFYAEESMMRGKALSMGADMLTKEGKAHVADLKEKTQRKIRT